MVAFMRPVAAAALASMLVGGSLVGCAPSSSQGPAELPTTMRVGIFHPDITFAAFYAAIGEDGPLTKVLEERNVEFQIEYIPSGSNLLAALNGGSVDVALVPASSLIAANDQGGDIVPVLGTYSGAGQMVVGAAKHKSRGDDVAAYDGAQWAFTRIGSVGHAVARLVAEEAGLDWKKQVELPLGSGAEAQAVLETGRADILVTSPVNAARAIQSDVGYLVKNSQDDENNPMAHAITNAVAVGGDFAEKYPEFTQEMTTAVMESLEKLKTIEDPDEVLALMPEDFVEAVKDTWDDQWKLASSGIKRASGGFTEREVEETIASAKLSGSLDQSYVMSKNYFSNKYAIAAFEKLGAKVPEGIK